jgi:uncharacterized protein (DUF1499 family)
MGWLRNWHDTDEPGADPGPLDLALPPPEALARLESALRGLPRWQVESADAAAGIVTATRRTRLFRFTDDVTIGLEPIAGGTRLHARSRSRVGASDLGQNRRNLIELFNAILASGAA